MNKVETMRLKDKMVAGVSKGVEGTFKLLANVKLILRDGDGKIKHTDEIHNTVPAVGLNAIMDQLLASPTEAKPGWMELGEGTPSTTKLGDYVAGSRTALSAKTRADEVITMRCTFAAGVGTGALTEAGIFGVVTEDSGTMYVSASFGVITKAAADSLEIIWTLTAAAA